MGIPSGSQRDPTFLLYQSAPLFGVYKAAILTSSPSLSDSVGDEWWLKFAPRGSKGMENALDLEMVSALMLRPRSYLYT